MTAATANRTEEPQAAEQEFDLSGNPLADHLERVKHLRRMTEQLAKASENIEHMRAQLEAGKAALDEVAERQTAALLKRIKEGHEDLADHQHRKFHDERRSLAAILRDMPVDLDELPALQQKVEQDRAELARSWREAREAGRRAACETLEQQAHDALSRLEDPRATVLEVMQAFESARDLAEAHASFWNSPAGKELLADKLVAHPDGKNLATNYEFGVAGLLADRLRIKAIGWNLQHVNAELCLEPNAAAVADIVESFRATWCIPPFSPEEVRLERVLHVTPAGKQALKYFIADPDSYRGLMRIQMEARVRELKEAGAALEALRSQPF